MNARRASRFPIAAAALILLLSQTLMGNTAQRYSATGLVLEIKGPQRFVVSCSEIPGFMDAMVMTFNVADAKELKDIRPGTMVDFTLVVGGSSAYAESIKVHHFQSPEQKPMEVERLKAISGLFAGKTDTSQMLAVGEKMPQFSLVDQHGRPVKFSDWSGKVVVISFMYSRCSSPEFCLRLTNNLGLVGKRFAGHLDEDLVLVTVTFDPKNDSPQVLEQYASSWKASAKGWYFLTGSPEEVKRLCLKFGMNSWADMGMIVHAMHTAVIDRNGRLVANLEGNDFSGAQLGNLVATVLDRKP